MQIKALLQCYFGDKDNATIETLVAAFQKDVDEQCLNVDEVHYLALFDENENADQVRQSARARKPRSAGMRRAAMPHIVPSALS